MIRHAFALSLFASVLVASPGPSPQPSVGGLALVGVNVIPMTGEAPLLNQTLVIRGDVIAAIGDARTVEVPQGFTRIEAAGRFVMPGLWDMHVHLMYGGKESLPLFVAQGVTGIRDMGGDARVLRAWTNTPGTVAPRLVAAAGSIPESTAFLERVAKLDQMFADKEGVGPLPARIEDLRQSIGVGSPADVEGAIERLKVMNADFVKIRTVASRETFLAIAAEAKRAGLPLSGHAPEPDVVSLEEASNAGQATFEHMYVYSQALGTMPEADRQRLYKLFVRNGTWITPTVATEQFRLSALTEVGPVVTALLDGTSPQSAFLTPDLSAAFRRDWQLRVIEERDYKSDPAAQRRFYETNLRYLSEMHAAGVRILAGTDLGALGMLPGYGLHEELRLLVEKVGMTPADALRAATAGPAEFLGLAGRYGTVAVGKQADLVLLSADPLADIRNTRRIEGVLLGGVYRPAVR